MPIAATSVAGSPLLSTPSGAAFFDGTPMVRMAVADRDRRDRQPSIAVRGSCKRLYLTAADVGRVLENRSRLFSGLNRLGQPDLVDGIAHPLQRIFHRSTAPRQSGRQ